MRRSFQGVNLSVAKNPRVLLLAAFALTLPAHAQPEQISGQVVYNLTQQFLAVAPKRYNGSPGYFAAGKFITDHFKPEAARGNFEKDEFTVNTSAGPQTMRNYIVKYPGKKDGIIVLASHYETNYNLRDINFVGANDGACTTALLISIGQYLRVHPPQGYSVWLLFDDGEESVSGRWDNPSDELYGTRHLAAKWYNDGTLRRIKAFIVADMIGDKDLDIYQEQSGPSWLRDILLQAAANTHHSANISRQKGTEDDDHVPFVQRGVPAIDVIDIDYGPHTMTQPDGYHHTAQDTIDKISAHSLQVSADIFMEMIRLINQR
jgi:Zn-dependent M28 family amino/carboxypeptidase